MTAFSPIIGLDDNISTEAAMTIDPESLKRTSAMKLMRSKGSLARWFSSITYVTDGRITYLCSDRILSDLDAAHESTNRSIS